MYDVIDIYKKEMNVDLMKINNYFESAAALYEATADIYFDDSNILYEASSTFKEKVKKTFTAIIEAIKSFFKKCRDAIHEKLVESRVKKAFADVAKYAKSGWKTQLKSGNVSSKKYKEMIRKINDTTKAYAKIYIMSEKITKDVLSSNDLDTASKYYIDGCDRLEAFVNSLDKGISSDIEQFMSTPECFWFVDTSDIVTLNKNMQNMENDCVEHMENLYAISIKNLAKELEDEITESTEEDGKKQSATQKITLIQKLANFVASLTKKISSIITSFTIKILSGVVGISGKLADKIIEHETKKQAKKAES